MSRIKVVALMFTLSMLVAAPSSAAKKQPDRPSKVVMIVLDQARPDTITRYGMTNVQELQRKGQSFPNAYVGSMAAETVISHNVMTSGRLPKNMGWSNEVYRDTEGVLGDVGKYYVTSSMSCLEYKKLIEAGKYPKIQDYLDREFGETSSFGTFSQKRSSACTAGPTSSAADGTAADAEDVILQVRGSAAPLTNPADPGSPRVSCDGRSSWRQPESANGPLPPYFEAAAPCNRWWTWQGAGAYGTGSMSPANIYPLEGDRFVPGKTPGHVGGDNWSADAAIRFIENEPDWRGIVVSLGGIDKAGHMWGPEDEGEPGAAPGSVEEMRRMPFIARNADAQVGRIIQTLKTKELLDDTLVVVTADHAAQTGRRFHGVLAPGITNPLCSDPPKDPPTTSNSTGIRSDCNWYFGQDADEIYNDPSDAVAGLEAALGGNLAFSYQDTQVGAWLTDTSVAKKREAAAAVLQMPDVVASFRTNAAQDDYLLYGTKRMTGAERSWFANHADELVDTMASPNAPDVVGLTGTDVTYGAMGDHGGSNQLVQRIPMVFYGGGVGSKDSNKEIRLVDLMPTVLRAMGVPYDEDSVDGEAVKLSKSKR